MRQHTQSNSISSTAEWTWISKYFKVLGESLNYATMATWLPKMPSEPLPRPEIALSHGEQRAAGCALIAAKIDATSVRPFEESRITFAGSSLTESTRNEIQNNCAKVETL